MRFVWKEDRNNLQELMMSLEKDEWKSTGDLEGWKNLLSGTATNTLAIEEGIPYQTLVASIIHKYVTGRFTERQPG